jgi:hypothetical protein
MARVSAGFLGFGLGGDAAAFERAFGRRWFIPAAPSPSLASIRF